MVSEDGLAGHSAAEDEPADLEALGLQSLDWLIEELEHLIMRSEPRAARVKEWRRRLAAAQAEWERRTQARHERVEAPSSARRLVEVLAHRADLAHAAALLIDTEACAEGERRHFRHEEEGGSADQEAIAERIAELARRLAPLPGDELKMLRPQRGERRVVVLEFLTGETFRGEEDIGELVRRATQDDLSMATLADTREPIDGPTLARRALAQGTDPGFFGLDLHGEQLDE